MQAKHLCVSINIPISPLVIKILLTVPRRCFFCESFLLFMFRVCHVVLSVHCCLVATCWERADLLALVCDVYCGFVTFPCGILDQVCYSIVSVPDLGPLFVLCD